MKTKSEVLEEFKRSLVLPERSSWPLKQMVLAPVGLPGSGKTTVVKPVAEAFGLVRISSDEYRKLLRENGHDWGDTKDYLFPLDEELAAEGYSIAIDADACNPLTVAFIKKLAEKHSMEVFWIHLNTPKEIVFKRFKEHPQSLLTNDPERRIQNYEAQEERYKDRDLSFDYIYTFDTSRTNTDEQIQGCIAAIRNKLLN